MTITPPYGPWIELFRQFADEDGSVLVPKFALNRPDVDGFGSLDALAEEVRQFLESASEHRPLVLILEDLHWSDAASLDLLRVLGRCITDHQVLLVVTYRSDELTRRHRLSRLLPLLIRESHAGRVDLTQLDRTAISDLVRERYTLSPIDHHRLTDWLVDYAEGNPFFIEELLFSLTSTHLRQDADGSWSLSDLESPSVPPLLRQAIEGRLESLSDEERQLLCVGAVIGHQVPLDLWSSVSNAPIELLAATIELGKAASVIEDVLKESSWRFRHALIREALYEDMNALHRQEWHQRVAEVLVDQPQIDPDVVASHFQRAGDPRVIDWLIRAGERAAAEEAHVTAVERFENVLPLLAAAGEERRRGWVLFLVSFVVPFHNLARSIVYLSEAERLGREVGDELLVAYARLCSGYTGLLQSRLREGLTLVADALEAIERVGGDETPPVSLHGIFWASADQWRSGYAMWQVHTGELASAEAHLANLPTDASQSRRSPTLGAKDSLWYSALGQNHLTKGRISSLRGNVGEAMRSFEQAAQWFARGNVDSMLASTITNRNCLCPSSVSNR